MSEHRPTSTHLPQEIANPGALAAQDRDRDLKGFPTTNLTWHQFDMVGWYGSSDHLRATEACTSLGTGLASYALNTAARSAESPQKAEKILLVPERS